MVLSAKQKSVLQIKFLPLVEKLSAELTQYLHDNNISEDIILVPAYKLGSLSILSNNLVRTPLIGLLLNFKYSFPDQNLSNEIIILTYQFLLNKDMNNIIRKAAINNNGTHLILYFKESIIENIESIIKDVK